MNTLDVDTPKRPSPCLQKAYSLLGELVADGAQGECVCVAY